MRPRLLEVLLRYGARPNATDKRGATSLLLLALNAPPGAPSAPLQRTVEVLCAHGARWETALRYQSELAEAAEVEGNHSAGHATAEGVTLPHAAALAALKTLRASNPKWQRGESDAWSRAAPPTQATRWAMVLSGGMKLDWEDDSASLMCHLCASKFSFMKRRHHCRMCGVLCCHDCSSKKFPLAVVGAAKTKEAETKAQRACDGCFNRLSTDTYRFSGQLPAAIRGMDARPQASSSSIRGGAASASSGGGGSAAAAAAARASPGLPKRPRGGGGGGGKSPAKGGSSAAAAAAAARPAWRPALKAAEWKIRLTLFYEQHASGKVGDIPTILKKYAGHEPTMFGRVAGKYGVDLWMWEDEKGLYPHAVEVKGAGVDSGAQRSALLGGASGGSASAEELRKNPSRAGKRTMAALGEARNALVDRGERLTEMSASRVLRGAAQRRPAHPWLPPSVTAPASFSHLAFFLSYSLSSHLCSSHRRRYRRVARNECC